MQTTGKKRVYGPFRSPSPSRKKPKAATPPIEEMEQNKVFTPLRSAQPEVRFKADWEITKEVIQHFAKSEKERAPERVLLIPSQKEPQKWLAYHPDNPTKKFSPVGSYVYVTHCQDKINPEHPQGKKIAAWPVVSTRIHTAKFHMGLSEFSQHLAFAGEVHFGKTGNLKYFDSSSGTYNPKPEYKAQAGFDPAKYKKPTFAF